MAPPDLLTSVGLHRRKIGSNDTEPGYLIKRKWAASLLTGVLLLGTLVVTLAVYEVRFERRSFFQQLRQEEHQAALKLARVQMELWAHYRDDIQESGKARTLLRYINASYSDLQERLQVAVDEQAKKLSLDRGMAIQLADEILNLVANNQRENIKRTKHLVDHLVAQGKRGAKGENHVHEAIRKEATAERKRSSEMHAPNSNMGVSSTALEKSELQRYTKTLNEYLTTEDEDDEDGGDEDEDHDNHDIPDFDDDGRPLVGVLEGFWATFRGYRQEYSLGFRKTLQDGSVLHDKIKKLHSEIVGSAPPDEEEIMHRLDDIDLVGDLGQELRLGETRGLSPENIVDELFLTPRIPFQALEELEESWQKEPNEAIVASKLMRWHQQGAIPSAWWEEGASLHEDVELRRDKQRRGDRHGERRDELDDEEDEEDVDDEDEMAKRRYEENNEHPNGARRLAHQ